MMDVCCPGLGIELKNYTHKPIEQKVFKNVCNITSNIVFRILKKPSQYTKVDLFYFFNSSRDKLVLKKPCL